LDIADSLTQINIYILTKNQHLPYQLDPNGIEINWSMAISLATMVGNWWIYSALPSSPTLTVWGP
jgi:hypothetical protein